MNLTLVKKLLQRDVLCQLLECIQNSGHKTLITLHHATEEIHHVLERLKKDGEHHWWETLLGWLPIAMGVFNFMFHPALFLLTLILSIAYNYIAYKGLVRYKTNTPTSTKQNTQINA